MHSTCSSPPTSEQVQKLGLDCAARAQAQSAQPVWHVKVVQRQTLPPHRLVNTQLVPHPLAPGGGDPWQLPAPVLWQNSFWTHSKPPAPHSKGQLMVEPASSLESVATSTAVPASSAASDPAVSAVSDEAASTTSACAAPRVVIAAGRDGHEEKKSEQ